MRGTSLDVSVITSSPSDYYTGPTVPPFTQNLAIHSPDSKKLTKYIDVSAVLSSTTLGTKEIRLAIVNRHENSAFDVPIHFGPNSQGVAEEITVHEVWHEDLRASNGFDGEKVRTVVKQQRFSGIYKVNSHSFQGTSFTLVGIYDLF